MKRAGEHDPAARPSAKQQKTVTFLLPAKRPRSPSGGATTAPSRATRPRGADDGGGGSRPPPPPQQPAGALDRQASSSNFSGMSSSQHSAGSSAGSLGNESGRKAPSRFSFDFMDDSLSSRSSRGLGSVQSSSPRAGSGPGRWSRPSPNRSDRLDARYSSRLPPSYARSRSDVR